MEEATRPPSNEGATEGEGSPAEEAGAQESGGAPARPARQPAPPPIGLDARGEALKELLPGPLEPFEPEIDTALDEVVVTVPSERLLDACATLRGDPSLAFDYLRCLSVVDYEDRFQVVYHLWSREHRHKLTLKVDTTVEAPSVPSVTGVWRGADWFEREGYDLFGVEFPGHPDPRVLILYEGFEGFPGRKSFPFHDYQEW